jgi:hypothetical protein
MSFPAWADITDGTEQNDRFPSALKDAYFNADELSFEDLLALSTEFAFQLHFYNLNNERDGNWSELFTSDESVITAIILSTDTRRIEAEFLRLMETNRGNPALAECVYKLAFLIDFWFRKLKFVEHAPAKGLSWHIASVVENKLAADLHSLGTCVRLLRQWDNESLSLDFSRFDPMWEVKKENDVFLFPKSRLPELKSGAQAKNFLRSNFYSFLNAVSYLKKIASQYLHDSLHSKAHNPAMGLFLAFLMLFRRAQGKINTFTQRHLDFYYHRFLKFVPEQSAPDCAYLTFEADAGYDEVFIRSGTEFTAGKDESGEEVVYRADNDLLVSDVIVQSLYTLNFERDSLISPERELNYVSRIQSSRISATEDSRASSRPLFGAAKNDARNGPAGDTEMGFAIASPLFFLGEGYRKVEVILIFNRFAGVVANAMEELSNKVDSEETFFSRFGEIFSCYLLSRSEILSGDDKKGILETAERIVSDKSFKLIGNLLHQDRQDLFYTLFRKVFNVSLTTEAGWKEVTEVVILKSSGEGREARDGLKIIFTLGPDFPPVVPYAREIHGGFYEAGLPSVRFRIDSRANFYPYSVFDVTGVREIVIETSVKGITGLVAYNNHGQLDPTKPFNPFGPLPNRNSYFVTGSHEVAVKKVTELRLNVEWGELPNEAGGFDEYYIGYKSDYSNETFKADVSILRDGQWLPENGDMRARTKLFDSKKDGSGIEVKKALKVNILDIFKPAGRMVGEDEFRFDQRARNGFFKFTLTEPENAFGHKEYPVLLMKILSENARLKKLKIALPLPNPPYTPLMNRITLDYTAKSVMDVGRDIPANRVDFSEKLFHLHPFGMETVYPPDKKRSITVLPHYGHDGNLFIGFSACKPGGILTLFFSMREDSSRDSAAEKPVIAWFYLASNQWRRLKDSQVLSDTTDVFLSSGIVTLDIPDDIDRENTIMPSGLFWLRVSVNSDMESFCSLYTVTANAVKATRCPGGDAFRYQEKRIPAGRIQGTRATIAGLRKVSQPSESFGGKAGETPLYLKTRICERLRHKNRAVLPWDYERLILERFPAVFKVKCFSAMDSNVPEMQRPGHVLIVVVPRMMESRQDDNFTPMMNSVELDRIREFVRKLTSPFVEIEVRNPSYEWIQVRCAVKLASGAEAQRGYYLNKLNRVITDFISPWRETGYKARFGWCVRRADIESHILGQEYVDFVTRFSMLHITWDKKSGYCLGDTARRPDEFCMDSDTAGGGWVRDEHADLICPKDPWSLAIPARDHFIEPLHTLRPVKAEATGISELQVGNTFIIGA